MFSGLRAKYIDDMETQKVDLRNEKNYYSEQRDATILRNGLSDEQLQEAKEIRIPELLAPHPDDSALNVDLLA